jgi:hypothetical protein
MLNIRASIRSILKGLPVLGALWVLSAAPAGAQNADGFFVWQGDGLKLETAPLPRDRVVAFMLARGFDSDTARMIAEQGCIFRSAIGSDAGGRASVTLSDWQVLVGGQPQGMRTRQKWAQVLQDQQADPGAAIALEWALFPTEQSFGPDDYNWGLLSFALPPGTRFDLAFSWVSGDTGYEQKFTNMECAK